MHKCDNPPCANPKHLYWGTDVDNKRDVVIRNRMPKGNEHWTRNCSMRGENSVNARITDKIALEIRALAAAGITRREIQNRLHVTEHIVRSVIVRRTWTHV